MALSAIDVQIGNRVRQLREERGIDCGGLAERLGISEGLLHSYETGELRIRPPMLFDISLLLGVKLGAIFDWDEDDSLKSRSPESGKRH